jgi:hypothetical protein
MISEDHQILNRNAFDMDAVVLFTQLWEKVGKE